MDQNLFGPLADLLWVLLFWVIALFLVTAGLYMTLGPALRQGRAQRRVAHALSQMDLPAMHDLVLRTRYGGLIQVDHVVRLPTGFVVLETVMRTGRLAGSARARVWRQDIGLDRHTFGNPLRRLDRAMDAVRRALPPPRNGTEAPLVTGQVLIPARTRFARARPEGTSALGDFLNHLRAANDEAKDQPPNPALDRAWRGLANAGLAASDAADARTLATIPLRIFRHLIADPRTAVGLLFTSLGGLLVLGLGIGAIP